MIDINNSNLRTLLNEYSIKRNIKINEAQNKKNELYTELPELEKIDNDINKLSIDSIKQILTTNNKENIKQLNKKIEDLKKVRTDILKKNHLTVQDLQPDFDCKKCNDTGYEKDDVLCSCIKQKLYNLEFNSANIFDLQNQCFDNFRDDLYSNSIDKDQYNYDISPRENIKKIKNACLKFIDNFDDPNEKNLLFCGYTGLGKTFLSSCIANEMIKKGKTVLYQTAPLMLDNVIDYKFGKTNSNILDSIYNVDLLIIDDLGVEAKNSIKNAELFNIINTRLLNQNNKITKTIISTNLTLEELYDTYEERIVSRFFGNYNAYHFYGDDIRLKKKTV